MKKRHKLHVLFLLIFCLPIPFVQAQSTPKFRVTLDAGHGDHDFGAVYNGHIEKNISLAVMLKVGKILERNPNIEVNYTRKGDQFIDLVERSNIANRADANIFVSMHCNANKNPAAEGTETYVMGLNKNASNLAVAKSENAVITLEKDYKQKYEGFDPNNPGSMLGVTLIQEEYLENSIALASKVQDEFSSQGRKVRGVKQAPFMVLHKAYMPRVLIEMGFISNPKEGTMLDSEEGQQETAESIAAAILSYKKEYFGNGANEKEEVRPSKRVVSEPVIDSSPVKSVSIKNQPAKTQPVKTEPVAAKMPEPKKEEPKKEEPKIEMPKPEPSDGNVIFKVQIAAVGKKIETTPANFKGLGNVSAISEGGLYKYTYGETSDYNTAKKYLGEAKAKGYAGAYIIAFREGHKITVQEALK